MFNRVVQCVAIISFLSMKSQINCQENISNSELCNHCGKSLSQAFIEVAKKGRPSVVHIRCEQGKRGSKNGFESFQDSSPNLFERFQEDLFNKFFGFSGGDNRSPKTNSAPVSSGSGFIVSSDGYIITNHHVVKDAARIIVEKYDDVEKEFEAKLVGCDPNTDIAVLKIECNNLVFLEFADSDKIQVGQWSMAIGHPFRLRDSVTAGVISATNRGDLQISQLEDFIQTDTAMNPGNSGGPLMDLNCKVIGVNTAILSQTGGSIGVGFAVPSNIASMVFEQIKKNGSVDRAFLGVQIQDLNESLCIGFKIKKGTTGALISEVMENSPAASSGLLSGDIVVEFNGDSIKNSKQLYNNLGKLASGNNCEIKIIRDGKFKIVKIVLGSKTKDVSEEGDIIYRLGIIVEQVIPENANKFGVKTDDKGVVITRVFPGSLAEKAGWREGSVIMVVNGDKIISISDLKQSLERSSVKDNLVVLLNYKGRVNFYSIPHPMGSTG